MNRQVAHTFNNVVSSLSGGARESQKNIRNAMARHHIRNFCGRKNRNTVDTSTDLVSVIINKAEQLVLV